MQAYHIPALLNETIEALNINPDGIYVDATMGAAGHSSRILQELNKGRLIAFDQDPDAIKNVLQDERFTFIPANFRFISNYLNYLEIEKVDGILADLGVSFHQFDAPDRGFSYRFNTELDMRMNPENPKSAYSVLNTYDFRSLSDMFYRFGELRNANKIALRIEEARKEKPIKKVNELLEILEGFAPKHKSNQFLSRVFQAIRIEVNDELNALEEFLLQSVDVLSTNGRLVIISYHSLEDKMVKNFLRSGNIDGIIEKDVFGQSKTPFSPIKTKALAPSDQERQDNKRARSAKLRIGVRNKDE